MGAQTKPFLKLSEDLTFFVRATEVRLLNIVTSTEDREILLAQLTVAEGHAFNRSPFFTLEDAHEVVNEGWASRAERMRVIHGERREALAGDGIQLPPLPPLAHADNPRVTFGRECAQIAAAHEKTESLRGLVVILAPARMERPEVFEQALRELLAMPSLEPVRLIVVDLETSSVAGLAQELGEERAIETTCIVDREALREEQKRRIARAASAPIGAPLQAQIGFAAPQVVPPPRVGRPAAPSLPPELATALGASAALAGEAGAEVRRDVYAAAHAMQTGRGDDAIRHQRAAADRCLGLGLGREGCILELVLAAYHVQLQRPLIARDVYARAAARAEAFDKGLAARAFLGLGAALAVEREARESTLAYARAGELAQEAKETLIALEAFRLAGQVALEATSTNLAMSMWQRALAVAEGLPSEAIAASSAATTARALAAACERRGLHAQARSLLGQADRFELGEPDPGPSE
jgi:hypothetical protein